MSWANQATNINVSQRGKNIVISYDLDKISYVELNVHFRTAPDEPLQVVSLYSTDKHAANTKHVSGDVGLVKAGNAKTIEWDVLADYERFVNYDVQFEVKAYETGSKMKTFLLAEGAYSPAPQLGYGAMFGQVYKYAGWYVSGISNFHSPMGDAVVDYDGEPFYNGQSYTSYYRATGGVVVDLTANRFKFSMLAAYVGAGYGQRNLYWQSIDNTWYLHSPNSYRGISAEVGLLASIYGVTVSVGVNTIQFKYMDFQIGLGMTIPTKFKHK